MALARLKGKIPKEIPFELKRCESCRRAKQGAIVCRVVRAHDGVTEPDGGDWAPPDGFREWLAAVKEGDGKSTVKTPTKKPKRPRPQPKPKEDEPERRSNATARQEAARAGEGPAKCIAISRLLTCRRFDRTTMRFAIDVVAGARRPP